MGKTRFQQDWKKEKPWVKEVDGDVYQAFCTLCFKRFRIDGSGISQVRSHAKCHKNQPCASTSGQRTFVVSGSKTSLSKIVKVSKCSPLSINDQVANAAILQALHHVYYNQSFSSAGTDNQRFKIMFPDSDIAKKYEQGKTKIKYTIQFGIAPLIMKNLIAKMKGVPFTFKFDETTTSQVKKTL